MDGFQRRKEQKRDNILKAAFELFQIYGFKKVSINDIAYKANVSQVTIYNHFGSKDGLIREVVQAQLQSILDRAREIMAEDKPFPEKLETIVFDKTEIASQFRGELMKTALQNDPEMQQSIDSLWQTKVNQVTIDVIEEGKRQGFINPQQSHEALLLYLEILRRGVFASSDLIEKIEPDTDFFRELNYMFIYGLIGKRE